MADAETKDEILHKLGSRSKQELVEALGSKLTKDDLLAVLGSRLKKDELAGLADAPRQQEPKANRDDEPDERESAQSRRPSRSSARPAANLIPSNAGLRVRVDVSGLPMLGVYAGRGARASGTITGIDEQTGAVTVHLDAGFGGSNEIVVPPSRLQADI